MTYISNFLTIFKKNQLLFQVFLLIVLNYLATRYFYQTFPEEELYQESSIFIHLYQYISLALIGFILAPLLLYKEKWHNIIERKYNIVKYFIFFIFSIYAWGVITLDFNLYFNNAYHLDRIILITLFTLSFRFPIFFIYFIIFSLLFYNQINYPDFGYFFPKFYVNIKPLVEVLILFIVFIFIKKIYTKFSILSFVIVLIAFHAANYFIPGLGKIYLGEYYIDWIWVNDLSNIFIAKYSKGWLLGILSLQEVDAILKWISPFIIPMQLFAFFIQIGALFIFLRKRFTIILFISFELLHLGIFIASGIFFWRWILLNITIVYIVNKLEPTDIKRIFNKYIMLFSIPFILLGNGFFHAYNLAWYDTPLHNFNEIYAITEDGKKEKMDINLFSPYHRIIYIETLNYFINQPLKSRWDTTDRKIMKKLTSISKNTKIESIKEEIMLLEQQYGTNEFNNAQQKKILKFLKIFFHNLNEYKGDKNIWSYLSPMRHIYSSFNWEEPLKNKSKIKEIEILFNKNFYSHKYNRLIPLEKRVILKVKIE